MKHLQTPYIILSYIILSYIVKTKQNHSHAFNAKGWYWHLLLDKENGSITVLWIS